MTENGTTDRPMLERIFLGYDTGLLQDFVNVLELMNRHGITIEAFLEKARDAFRIENIINFEKSKQVEVMKNKYLSLARRCALCGKPMKLYRVNDRPGTQVGGEFKSMWYCPDLLSCGETVYSNLTIEEEAERYGVKSFIPRQSTAPRPKSDPAENQGATDARRKNFVKRCGRSPRR